MKRKLAALAAAAAIGVTALAIPGKAEAHSSWWIPGAIAGGFAAGAIVSGAYGPYYYAVPYTYEPAPYYYYVPQPYYYGTGYCCRTYYDYGNYYRPYYGYGNYYRPYRYHPRYRYYGHYGHYGHYARYGRYGHYAPYRHYRHYRHY
jgi:hypothetical protein